MLSSRIILAFLSFALMSGMAESAAPKMDMPMSMSMTAANDTLAATALKIGDTLTAAHLTDLDGRNVTLSDLSYDRALVVIFSSIVCPVSVKYNELQAQIYTDYGPKGVRLIVVNPNFNEANSDVKAYYRNLDAPFPVYRDLNAKFADHVGATHTPEAFLFDKDHRLRYRGEIDNGWGVPENVTSRGLLDALNALLAGRDIAHTERPSFGCVVRHRPKAVTVLSADTPTFYRDILPFLQNRCQGCHHPGAIGRVPFIDYTEVLAWGGQMADSIKTRTMPPWQVQPNFGEFKETRRLSGDEIRLFTRWVDAGMPEGDSTQAPKPRVFPKTWTLGKPDMVLTPEAPYPLPAVGRDEYRCFVLQTHLKEDRDIAAIEVLPGQRNALHHAAIYIDVSGKARMLQEEAPKPGYPSFGGIGVPIYETLGLWAPGNTPFILPDGVGRHLPAGSDIVLQIHYHKTGQAVEDLSRLGLYFTKKPVKQHLYEEIVNSRLLFIPPGEKHHKVVGSITIPQNQHILGIMPHMHLLGTEMKVTATYPDGTVVPLIWVKPWDFNWQETYIYKKPVALPRGTRVVLEAYYDNSADNPRNPNHPPKLVRWGEQSTDEMCIAFLYVTRDDENLLQPMADRQ